LHFRVFNFDPVDIDDPSPDADAPAETLCQGFIDKAKPPAEPLIVAQDRAARTGLNDAFMKP